MVFLRGKGWLFADSTAGLKHLAAIGSTELDRLTRHSTVGRTSCVGPSPTTNVVADADAANDVDTQFSSCDFGRHVNCILSIIERGVQERPMEKKQHPYELWQAAARKLLSRERQPKP